MKIHKLKCWPDFYEAIEKGDKTFEARRNDRNFKVNDLLHLREWSPADSLHSALGTYSGRECWFWVTYVLHGSEANQKTGIAEGSCVMGIARAAVDEVKRFTAKKRK